MVISVQIFCWQAEEAPCCRFAHGDLDVTGPVGAAEKQGT
jgi:hypothetical protein